MRVVSLVIVPLAAAGLFACSNDAPGMSSVPMLAAAGSGTQAAGSAPSATAGSAPPAAGSIATGAGGAGSAAPTTAAGSGAATAGSAAAAGSSAATAGSSAATAGSSAASAGSSAAAGSMAEAGSGGAAGSSDTGRAKSPCLSKGSQVVFIGDSYINYDVAHTLLSTLIEQLAVKDGALKSGEHYRNYAVPGTALAADNFLGMIPPQWDMAVADDPDIKVVIMDGGGNDVLIDNMQCLAPGSDKDANCQKVVMEASRVGTELISKMKDHGVSDGIYFFYPHVPLGGDDINDYSLKLLQQQSMSLVTDTFHPYVLDTIPIFEGHDDWFASDDIHANDMGEMAIAEAIWKIMKDNCIGQPESSGCCAP